MPHFRFFKSRLNDLTFCVEVTPKFEFFELRTIPEILGKIAKPEVTSSACFSVAPMDFRLFLNLDFV